MPELVLLNISGEDKPGVTAEITQELGKFDIDVLDIGQAVIHKQLVLGILMSLPTAGIKVISRLTKRLEELNVTLRCHFIDLSSYDEWMGLQGQPRFILTLLTRRIKAHHIAAVSQIVCLHQLNIDSISRLSGQVPITQYHAEYDQKYAQHSKACIEFSLQGELVDTYKFRADLMQVASELEIDIAVQEDSIYRRQRRLVAFDMDSTLITVEVIDELAELVGMGDTARKITAKAMAGDLDFQTSLRKRVALLKGLPESSLAVVAERLTLTEGAEHLFQILNRLGYKTAILSGGFNYFAAKLQAKLGINYVYANNLEVEAGLLTGRLLAPIVDAQAKADLLIKLAQREQICLEQVIAVGDGANDLAMLATAGLGIAFHAKPVVNANAQQVISNLGLDSILYLMGIGDHDVGS